MKIKVDSYKKKLKKIDKNLFQLSNWKYIIKIDI